ncbi:MAG TPA: PQQ-binding-like beta-propeller repeat protein [Candidatus Polarisedimenticolia bacterium]|nr:PQQ-binding-like beta-propeller repeat protein [Candidatus Polarisedimenticolia bacterium]
MNRPGESACRLARTAPAALLVWLAAAWLTVASAPVRSPEAAWPSFRGTPQLTGAAGAALPGELKPIWTFQAGGGIESTAAILGGAIYVGGMDGKLYALDFESGALRWTYAAGAGIKSSPTAHGPTVYFGDENGVFHAVDAVTGSKRWTYQAGAAIVSSAAVVAGRAIFGSNDNHLYALDAGSGSMAWKVETGGYVYGTPAVRETGGAPAVVSAGCDGFLRIVKVSDGAELGRIELGAYVGASPALSGNRAWVGTFENQVLGVDLEAGKVIWSYEHPERKFPYYASAALGEGILVIGGRDRLVHALDPGTGRAVWIHQAGSRVDASPVIAGDRVFVATTGGDLLALSLASGAAVWRFQAGSGFAASPALAAGRLVVGSSDGTLYAFGGG